MAIVTVVLPLDDVVEGMELDADVVDGVGRPLVKAGVAVTEKHLRIFSMCGIRDLRVRREVPDEEVAPDPALLAARAEAEEALRPRFRVAGLEYAPMQAIFTACVDRHVKRARWTGGTAHA